MVGATGIEPMSPYYDKTSISSLRLAAEMLHSAGLDTHTGKNHYKYDRDSEEKKYASKDRDHDDLYNAFVIHL